MTVAKRGREDHRILRELQGQYWREGANGTKWTVEKLGRNIHRVTMLCDTPHAFEWHGLLSSDRHHDNAHTDQNLERKHLDEIIKRKGVVRVICTDPRHKQRQG